MAFRPSAPESAQRVLASAGSRRGAGPSLAWLISLHRWLGTAGGLVFIAWFISGIAMMYVRMPTVTPEARSLHAEPLDVSTVRITPGEAAREAGVTDPDGMELGMLRGRPVYRFLGRAPTVVFADDGTT